MEETPAWLLTENQLILELNNERHKTKLTFKELESIRNILYDYIPKYGKESDVKIFNKIQKMMREHPNWKVK